MDKQLAKAVADYMAETSDLRGRLVHKIASLSKENEQLRKRAIPSSAFKAVVSSWPPPGLWMSSTKAHFDSTTKDDNVGMQLEKLAAYLQKSVVEKEASVQSPTR